MTSLDEAIAAAEALQPADLEPVEPDPGPVRTTLCTACRAKDVKYAGTGECGTCYEYRRRTGKQRPVKLTRRQADLNWRAEERRIAARAGR